MCLTGNAHPHREWGCASPGMGVCLTGNAHSLCMVKRECNLNQLNVDSVVERVANDNSEDNDDRHKNFSD